MGRRGLRLGAWFLGGVLLILCAATAWMGARLFLPAELSRSPQEFEVRPGTSLRTVARELAAAGLVPDALSFVTLARLLGREGSIKAGSYEFSSPVSAWEVLQRLARGDVILAEITLIEGWSFKQLRKALDEHPGLRHDTAGRSEAEILAAVGATEASAEGLFFPDTYYFSKGSSDVEILKRAYHTMQRHLERVWASRAPDLAVFSPYEALILASIIEKETGAEADRSMVSGVFHNRLRLGMRLQSDPTVIYGMGDAFDGNLRKRDLSSDHDYNTYTRPGLPPTPIALPGLASLKAAVQPAQTQALYFVSRGDGTSEFSETLADHNRAVNRYQKPR
ncbi:MAG: endolytic transglycosylase MltG [Pseudomonadota bacterium]